MTRSLCAYRNALGVPGQGVHARRIFGLAMWDIVGTLVVAAVLAAVSRRAWGTALLPAFLWAAAGLLVLGEALHCLFCVSTPITRFLGCA